MKRLLRWVGRCVNPLTRAGIPASAAWRRRHWIERALAGIDYAVIATDPAGCVMFLNAHAEGMTGWPLAKAYGRPLEEIVPLSDERSREPVHGLVARVVAGADSTEWVRHKVLTVRDGRVLPVEYRTAPICRAGGQPEGVVLLVRDVTGQRRVQEAMAQLAAIVEYCDDAIVGVTMDGTVTNWNAGAERLYGYSADEIVGQPLKLIYPPDRSSEIAEIRAAVKRGEPIRHFDTVRLRRDGAAVAVSVSLSPIRDQTGQVVGFSSIGRDITERKRAEEEMRRTEVLRKLADAQEGERRRIARELHDGLGQHLTALKLGLEAMRLGPHDPDQLQKLLETTKQIGQETRRIAVELRPTALDDLGLRTALNKLAEEWSAQSGVEVDIQDSGLDGVRLPSPVETALYRVTQEALTNVLKHARAGHVSLILEKHDAHVLAIIEDDGAGFDYDAVTSTKDAGQNLGLPGMRERVAAVGGEFRVETSPGEGTSLFIRIPIPEESR